MRTIRLNSRKYPGLVVQVDEADYAWLAQYSWVPNNSNGKLYARGKVDGHLTYMHQLLCPTASTVDHIDGNSLNNRRDNLRPATGQQQHMNKRHHTSARSIYKGIWSYGTKGRWRASIKLNGKPKHLGCFDTELEAAIAYDTAAKELHGAYANLNFPEGR